MRTHGVQEDERSDATFNQKPSEPSADIGRAVYRYEGWSNEETRFSCDNDAVRRGGGRGARRNCCALSGTGGCRRSVSSGTAVIHMHRRKFRCRGIHQHPSGHYSNITVAGACNVVPNAVITVAGSIDVNVGAVLDAQSAPSTIKVRQDVDAARGSLLGLGCLPNPVGKMTGHPCTVDPAESSEITVHGNIYGAKVNTVLLDGISVKGSVVLDGGGVQSGNPWPIKFDTIGGNLVVFNARPEWLGVINDSVHGDVILNKVTVAPGETMDVANNTIHLNLLCSKLLPAVSAGFVPGEINVVGGEAIGECPLAAS